MNIQHFIGIELTFEEFNKIVKDYNFIPTEYQFINKGNTWVIKIVK